MTKQCICQICNCGRHRCPHHPQRVINKSGSPCAITEYSNTYRQHPMQPVKSFKPTHEPMQNAGPLADKTTNRSDFIKHPMEKPHVHKGDEYSKPEGDIDTLTSYKKEYTEKKGQPAKAIKNDKTRKALGKFEGSPTYRNDYRRWSLDPRNKVVHDSGYMPPQDPFVGESTFTKDFIPYKSAPRQSMKPAETTMKSDDPFQDKTGYRDDYIKHQIAPKERKEKPEWSPNKAPLDGLSTYHKDYPGKNAPKQPSCKPDANAYKSDAPFEEGTTQRTDFKKWPSERPHVHEPDTYMKPEGDMDMHTTTAKDYTKKPLELRAMRKAPESKKSSGKFDGTTNYSQDFRKWQPGDRPKMTMKSEYVPPDSKFEGQPTYQNDYIKHNQAPRHAIKPDVNAMMSDQPFDDRTGYRDDYIKHRIPPKEKKEKQQWEPNKSRIDDMTTYHKDYQGQNGPKQTSCKPDVGAYQSNAPFEDGTTQRTDYKKLPTERPYVREADTYRKPEGDFDFYTTTNTDYNKKPLQKNAMKRPSSRKGVPGKFDGTTNYKEDFRTWQCADRPKMTMKSEYAPPDAPFEGNSNYTTDYIKHRIDPTRSTKPNDEGYNSGAPFEGGTMYRQDYTKKHVQPCPAAVIETGQSGFRFLEQDANTGHKYYAPKPVSVSISELPSRRQSADRRQHLTALSVA